jgi:hypothetical protein
MDDQSAAIVKFLGHTFDQLREIDNYIHIAGSNAKFGGLSAEIEQALKLSLTTVLTPVIDHAHVYQPFVESSESMATHLTSKMP